MVNLDKIRKVFTVWMRDTDSDEKVNLMTQAGWQILDRYTKVDEIFPYHFETKLFYVLGNENFDAQIPLTQDEIDAKKYHWENRPAPKSYD